MRIVDITERLNLDTRPVIVIAGEQYTVKADAETALKAFELNKRCAAGEIDDMELTMKALEVLLDAETVEHLQQYLLLTDLSIVAQVAMQLVTGNGVEELGDGAEEPGDGNFRT